MTTRDCSLLFEIAAPNLCIESAAFKSDGTKIICLIIPIMDSHLFKKTG